MLKLTLRIRFLTKINSGFRIVFNMRLENILQAHGKIQFMAFMTTHLPIVCVCVCCSTGPRNEIKWAKWPVC